MGRTNPTFRSVLEEHVRRWRRFRRALRHEDKPHFDSLVTKARRHADAAGHVNDRDPETAILLSMLLEQEKELAALEDEIEERAEGDGL
jgi:hypothetical protein